MLDLNFRITSGSIPLLALRAVRPDALDEHATTVGVGSTDLTRVRSTAGFWVPPNTQPAP